MHGGSIETGSLFCFEAGMPKDHPLRFAAEVVNDVLQDLSPGFTTIYSSTDRPFIASEKLLRALLLHASDSVRSER